MLDDECLMAYRKQYPKTESGFAEPSGGIMLTYRGKTVIETHGETKEIFFDRLKRSKETNKNLFFKEWEKFEYDPDSIY